MRRPSKNLSLCLLLPISDVIDKAIFQLIVCNIEVKELFRQLRVETLNHLSHTTGSFSGATLHFLKLCLPMLTALIDFFIHPERLGPGVTDVVINVTNKETFSVVITYNLALDLGSQLQDLSCNTGSVSLDLFLERKNFVDLVNEHFRKKASLFAAHLVH